MAAHFKTFIIILALFFLMSLSAKVFSADTGPVTHEEIVEYLVKNVAETYHSLENAILDCAQQNGKNEIKLTPEKILEHFEEAGLSWKDAVNAVFYLGQRNDYLCFHRERLNLLYATTSLDYIMDEFELEKKFEIQGETFSIRGMLESVLLRFSKSYEFEIKYHRLPDETKTYLEQHFGEAPFSYTALIDALKPDSYKHTIPE